jgi:hypothetical protein
MPGPDSALPTWSAIYFKVFEVNMIAALLLLLLGNATDTTPVMKEKKVATVQNLSTSARTDSSNDKLFRIQVLTKAIKAIEQASRSKRNSLLDEKLLSNRTVIQLALSSAICQTSPHAQNATEESRSKNKALKKEIQDRHLTELPCIHPAVEALIECSQAPFAKQCNHEIIHALIRILSKYLAIES